MKLERLPLLVGFAAASAISSAAGFSFTFDTDNEGWTRGNFSSTLAGIDVDAAGPAVWDPSGAIVGTDHADYAYHFSPDLGGGHGDLFGTTLSVDFRSAGPGGEDPFVVLVSGSGYLVKERSILASPTLDTYTFDLQASEGWYFNSADYYDGSAAVFATDADILAVLSDLRHIGVSTDIAGGGDSTLLDNVNAQAVPEPASMAAFGIAGLAFLRRRKRA